MKVIIGLVAAALVVGACNKEKFASKPRIEVKSVSSDVLGVGQGLNVTLEFFDKEGDVSDSIYVIRHRLNARDQSPQNPRTIPFGVPAFPEKSNGLSDINLEYSRHITFGNSEIPLPNSQAEPDTLSLRFYLRDLKGNVSDTVSLPHNIIVFRK